MENRPDPAADLHPFLLIKSPPQLFNQAVHFFILITHQIAGTLFFCQTGVEKLKHIRIQ